MKTTRSGRFMIGAMALLGVSFYASPTRAQEVHRLEGRRFRVSNVAGSVEIRPARTGTLVVEVRRGGPDADRLRLVDTGSPGEAALEVRYTGMDTVVYPAAHPIHSGVPVDGAGALGGTETMFVMGQGTGGSAWADLVIHLPPSASLDLDLGVGSVRAAGIAPTELDVSVQVGTISAEDVAGRLTARSGAGDVTLRGFREGLLSLTAGAGRVEVSGARAPRVELESGAGRVVATDLEAPRIDVGVGAGAADLELVGRVERMEITAPTGPVTLSVPAGFGARVRIVRRGDRRTDFAEHVETRVLGDASGAVSIRTGPGPVEITERGGGDA